MSGASVGAGPVLTGDLQGNDVWRISQREGANSPELAGRKVFRGMFHGGAPFSMGVSKGVSSRPKQRGALRRAGNHSVTSMTSQALASRNGSRLALAALAWPG